MDEKPDPGQPADPPHLDATGSDDPVSSWASQELSRPVNPEAVFLQRKRAWLEELDREIAGKSPAEARSIVDDWLLGERDPELRLHLEHMIDALDYREQQEREREDAFRSQWTARRLVTIGAAAVLLAGIVVVSGLAAAGELSCAPDSGAQQSPGGIAVNVTNQTTEATVNTQDQADTPPDEQTPDSGYQPQSPDQPETPAKPPSDSVTDTSDANDRLVAGAWRFEAVNPPTGDGNLGIYTLAEGRVTTDSGAGGTYEVRTDADGTINVEIELKDERSPARTWFHMVLLPDEGVLFGSGEALAINTSGNEGSTTTELKRIKFQTDIRAERVSAGE